MRDGHIDGNIVDTIFRVSHIHDLHGDAACLLCLWPPITPAVDPVRKAIPPPPPILSYIKYIASQVNRGVERKFRFGIRCFNP